MIVEDSDFLSPQGLESVTCKSEDSEGDQRTEVYGRHPLLRVKGRTSKVGI